MNTNKLKIFAQQARQKLIQQVGNKLNYVLTQDSAALREQQTAVEKLKKEIEQSSEAAVIEKVAYSWFNRLVALRYMDVQQYQPDGMAVISPKEDFSQPELLDQAKQGMLTDADYWPKIGAQVDGLLSGQIPAATGNAQNDAYKLLLIAACNQLHQLFPFLFEAINDYTDLLLPDDLLSEQSILNDVREGMPEEDCQQVEIIGWLYQFYISEKKDEVFAKKGKVETDEIPAATQLFTPRWIVEYMVQNTLGKLWLQNRPQSALREVMPYFIDSPSLHTEDYLKINSAEEIRFLDQACGSGHILLYGFELLTKIYEEEGFSSSEIPQLILEHNLFGFEIDERAAQLAGFALMMQARAYHRRVFRKALRPQILQYEDLTLSAERLQEVFHALAFTPTKALLTDLEHLQQATNLGSLIKVESEEMERATLAERLQTQLQTGSIFSPYLLTLQKALGSLKLLAMKYHCIVDNPPYMGGGNMNKPLSDFVKKNYPDSKADLMACFMEAGLTMLEPKGYLGMINQHSWMFLSSYEALRNKLVKNTFFDTLLHLGPRTFPEIGGEVVQNAAFTFWNTQSDEKGSYLRLVDFGNSKLKSDKTLEAIQNPDCGFFYTANQNNFQKIPGSPIGYWATRTDIQIFDENRMVSNHADPRQGLATGNNDYFLRQNWEVSLDDYNKRWFTCTKGGAYRKWFGNADILINWSNDGYELKNYFNEKGKLRSVLRNQSYYFSRSGFTWSTISSSKASFRVFDKDWLFESKGSVCFPKNLKSDNILLGFLNSHLVNHFLRFLAPTLDYHEGPVGRIPYIDLQSNLINSSVIELIDSAKKEWNSRETSFGFLKNELVKQEKHTISDAFQAFCAHWQSQFIQLHRNEEALNKEFIEIYGLQEELTPDVELKDITILRDEVDQKALAKISEKFQSGWELGRESWQLRQEDPYATLVLPFDQQEIVMQFISYAVGCMFGRYALEQEGLILANQGETLEDYLQKLGKSEAEVRFLPDEDNIIPVLDDEWFADDIVGRFYAFLKASFGEEHYAENLRFVEEALGKSLRKYFMADFYKDHIKRYKKRPIYWQFSSPSGSFNALIYMHRYNPDTLNHLLNGYLREYQEKLRQHMQHQEHIEINGTAAEQNRATKAKEKARKILLELEQYERDTIQPLALKRLPINLDDGVLVNYNRFGQAIKAVAGLNDAKTLKKVKGFDWLEVPVA
ncbi:BREX-1 system adenine-specific DNA-methyltransferase PglX [Persicobacter sp. CCB-QB2]|uniref:BREX-1 system adenine-specific DNA-methyltransferase PglX n=1 Tax=Persicobacter sp. CCB-QB2 TaxID=1561025 RepID=UPI0006A9B97A|nr:BREX-1 system adenine-specific DNA-methyltransferase PglX [Persicobacter sp. CCB-QB2]